MATQLFFNLIPQFRISFQESATALSRHAVARQRRHSLRVWGSSGLLGGVAKAPLSQICVWHFRDEGGGIPAVPTATNGIPARKMSLISRDGGVKLGLAVFSGSFECARRHSRRIPNFISRRMLPVHSR